MISTLCFAPGSLLSGTVNYKGMASSTAVRHILGKKSHWLSVIQHTLEHTELCY